MTTRFDAVIVGAGPAGAATAILLARAGWSVALVERQRFPRRKVCGECIAASNLPLLDALGVGAEVARLAGAELRRVALWCGARSVVADLPAGADPQRRYGRALGREQLDPLLVAAARAAGATVLQPASLQSIEGGPGDFRCRLGPGSGSGTGSRSAGVGSGTNGDGDDDGADVNDADTDADTDAHPDDDAGPGRVLRAGLVVAAHGSWEPLPSERAARRRARRPSDLFAFKANFRGARIAPDLLPVLAFDGGYGGMVVADDGVATLACCLREARLGRDREAQPGARAGDVVEALLRRECTGVAAALEGAVREGPWLATGPIAPGVRLGAGDGVFRVGNAAGEAHPIVGEGISMALQSAFVLGSVVARERAALLDPLTAATVQRRLLQRYEARWRERFARRLGVAAAFAHAAMRPQLAAALWPVVAAWPGVLTRGARWSGKTLAVVEATAWVDAVAAAAPPAAAPAR